MERRMRSPESIRWKATVRVARSLVAWTAGTGLYVPVSLVQAQTAPATATAREAVPSVCGHWTDALETTRRTGIPTVLVVTRSGDKGSIACWRSLSSPKAQSVLAGQVVVAELCAERDGPQVAGLGVKSFPCLVAYARTTAGELRNAATFQGSTNPEQLVSWVARLAPAAAVDASGTKPADPSVEKTGWLHGTQQPSPQSQQPVYVPQPVCAPQPQPAPAPEREVIVEREVVVEREPEPEVTREVVIERAAPTTTREVIVERVAPAPVTREVVVERAAPPPTTRNVLIRRELPPQERVVERAAPVRERVIERAAPVRERVIERAAPVRERVVERAAPREVVVERAAPREPAARALVLREPGVFDRMIGALGDRLRRRALPRVEVEVERQPIYRFATPAAQPVYEVERAVEPAPRVVYQPPVCQAPPASPPVYSLPPRAPSPQVQSP
jgi:hypothetical protein